MANLECIGAVPKGAIEKAVRALGAGEAPLRARLIVTRDPQFVPGTLPDGLPWLWLCHQPVKREVATEAVLRGAYDVIALSDSRAEERAVTRLRELVAEEPAPGSAPHMVAESPASKAMLKQIAQAARTSMPVLLTGETGTGKEVAAQLIHAWSARAKGPFMPINCAAIPNELMEGELFGYAKGAFSGAIRDYDGLMMSATGGTVFLDEVDDTPHPLQMKLLRVLEDRVVQRLGESSYRKADFRMIASTNRDLRRLIDEGLFGPDLYERLAIVSIQLPPLRDRLADVPALIDHFIKRFYKEEPAQTRRHQVKSVSREALHALLSYPWPGNIRELRNVVFGVLVYKRAGDELLLSDLPKRILKREPANEPRGLIDTVELERRLESGAFNLRVEVENLERLAVNTALRHSGGNANQAARVLGEVGRGSSSDPGGTVRAMAKRLGLARERGQK